MRRDDGSWLMDGMLGIHEAERLLERKDMRGDEDFETLAGFVLARLGRIPQIGDHFDWDGLRFEIVDMDGRRIDRILVAIERRRRCRRPRDSYWAPVFKRVHPVVMAGPDLTSPNIHYRSSQNRLGSWMPLAQAMDDNGERLQAASASGNSPCSPASDASQMPRSVMSPVTSRAGVTSKA